MIEINYTDLKKKINRVLKEYEMFEKQNHPEYKKIKLQLENVQKKINSEAIKRTHRNDPETSLRAAEMMVESGRLTKQQGEVFELWKQYPNTTAKEISKITGYDYYKIQRRKKELVDLGLLEETINVVDNSTVMTLKTKQGGKQCVNS